MYEAIDNIIPHIETRHTKIGGVSYQIPIDVSADRRLGLALRWLISSAHKRREAKMWLKLSWEIIDSALRKSTSYKICETINNQAKTNQPFSHLGW